MNDSLARSTLAGARALFVALLLLLGACGSKSQSQHKPDVKRAAPPDRLTLAMMDVVKSCTVNVQGLVRNCTGQAQQDLEAAEKDLHIVPSLESYCRMLGQVDDAKTRGLVASRIGALSIHTVLAEQGTNGLLTCLMKLLPALKGRDAWLGTRVVRAAAFLATAKGQEASLLKYLDEKAPPEVKQVGYECLWPNGRMRIFDQLERTLAGKDPALRRAVVLGFTYVDELKPEERSKVCGLLSSVLEDKDQMLVSTAANRAAQLCPASRSKLLADAALRLKRKQIDLGFVNALHAILVSKAPAPTAAERKRIVALLTRIVSTPEAVPKKCPTCAMPTGPGVARQAALRYLAEVEPKTAAKLEKKYFPKPKPAPASQAKKDEAKR